MDNAEYSELNLTDLSGSSPPASFVGGSRYGDITRLKGLEGKLNAFITVCASRLPPKRKRPIKKSPAATIAARCTACR